ncbi:Patatin family protein [Vibrio crassostreae]|nr:Patatin family protein [Vibrio crassostreae]CAK2693868.1 Patatin family protein [Vibrio crassostreae]CAK2694761.1 Patatin family protein [Vibrio crassostreae]CAK2698102.1 Patatin family protein [Vibrio crassostreae]CAK2701711.1 Patatin family protein [Vibrio crassostreae]
MNKIKSIIVMLLPMVLVACSSTHSIDKRVTEDNYESASIISTPKTNSIYDEPYRFFGDETPKYLREVRDNPKLSEIVNQDNIPRIVGDQFSVLVLSGGGERGSYGAGIINGLYDTGKLPEFSMVTGVSTGALTAPFVFAGGEYIHELKTAMLALNDQDLLDKRGALWPLYSTSMVEGKKFYQFIEKTYDDELIEAIAREYRKGKRLQIGTTHFDSGRQMVWNIGRIADSDIPNKIEIIHKVLMASSSIPGFFPPQYFTVYANGSEYEEMHVDGGLSHQLFFNSYDFDLKGISELYGITKKPNIYIIRNGYLKNNFEKVEDNVFSLSERSVNNLIFSQTRGDLYKEVYVTNKAQANTYLSYIEEDFDVEPSEDLFFDQEYMNKLYEYGYEKAQNGTLWSASLIDGHKIKLRDENLNDE